MTARVRAVPRTKNRNMGSRKTPLYQKHLQSKGRIIDFAGWALPLDYGSMLKEAKQVRLNCGLFDTSHMGEIEIKGKGAFKFLQKLTPNDISLIAPGQMQYNLFLNTSGGIIDDFMCYYSDEGLSCVVNSSNKDKVISWLKDNKEPGVGLSDKSEETALISLQGPSSSRVIARVFGEKIGSLDYMFFTKREIDNRQVLVSRSGYTGEDGFEIYIESKDAPYFWDRLIQEGGDFGLIPCGLGSRDILRIEAGYPLYGHEINEETNPYEASLGWAVKLNKDFIGKEEIAEIKKRGLKKIRVGFIMDEKAPAHQGYGLYLGRNKIGEVCSGTFSPNLNKFIGMAYVLPEYAAAGKTIEIQIRKKFYKAKIAQYPFVKINTKSNTVKSFMTKRKEND